MPSPSAADQQRDRDGGAERARDAEPLQAVDERREPVADQDAEDDRDEDRLRVLQDERSTASDGQDASAPDC